MRRFVRRAAALGLGLLGVGHLLFSIPNFGYARECESSPVSFSGCMVFYEGLSAVVAGLSLVLAAALILRRSYLGAASSAFLGTAVFDLFFWLAAIPTGLSDTAFGYLTLPLPLVSLGCLVALLAARRGREGRSRPAGSH